MFPTPEESQKAREELAAGIDAVIAKRRQYREDLVNGHITPEEHARLQKELTFNIFRTNQHYGSMGTGLDGHGEPIPGFEYRPRTDAEGRPIIYTSFPEILDNGIVDIWICIDGNKVNASACENYAHMFREFIYHAYGEGVQVNFSSGPTPTAMIIKEPLVLEATHHGFLIKKCPKGLTHNERYLHYPSVVEQNKVALAGLVGDENINKVTIFAITFPDTQPEEMEIQGYRIAELMRNIRIINPRTEVTIAPINHPLSNDKVIATPEMMGHMLTSWVTINVIGNVATVSKARGLSPSMIGREVL